MPSPFNKKPVAKSPAADDTVAVLNSVLVCQYCFFESDEGTYYPNKEWLVWDCDGCERTNVVKDISI